MIEWLNKCPNWSFLGNYAHWKYIAAIYMIVLILSLIKYTVDETNNPQSE